MEAMKVSDGQVRRTPSFENEALEPLFLPLVGFYDSWTVHEQPESKVRV